MTENSPDGYPHDDPSFQEAAHKVLQRRQADLEQAERFLRKMDELLRKK